MTPPAPQTQLFRAAILGTEFLIRQSARRRATQ
jgi:hypothetical protein